MIRLIPFAFLIACALGQGSVAAEFGNLGFEELGDNPLPEWQIFFGESRQLPVVNPYLFGPDGDYSGIYGFPPLTEGNFSLVFQTATRTSPLWTLTQVGQVPENAAFLAYRNLWSEMEVRINGQKVPALNSQLGGFAHEPTNLVYDISKYAGQEVRLEFIGPVGEFSLYPDKGRIAHLDSVRFILARISRVAARPETDGSNRVKISFDPIAPEKVIVEFRDDLLPTSRWQPLANQPTDSGSIIDVNVRSQRYYRLRIASP